MDFNLDFDVSNNLSSDDDQSFVFNSLSVNCNSKMFGDLFNQDSNLLNSYSQSSDDLN